MNSKGSFMESGTNSGKKSRGLQSTRPLILLVISREQNLGTKIEHIIFIKQIFQKLTLDMYSVSKSCRACRTALHSATIRSLLSSLVHEESAIKAAPLIMLSNLSSRLGLVRSSLYCKGSITMRSYK